MDARADRYPWVVMGIVLAGSYLVVLDTTVLGVALASMAEDLHAERSVGIDWVITSYLIAIGMVQPASAWLAERFGSKHVFMATLVVFTGASLLAGVAPNLELLIVARVLQGFGGGVMMPVGMAMVWAQFPPERRGMAISIHSLAVMAGPAFGPVFGGWVVTSVSWRWLFLVNLPIGLIALALAARFLRPDAGAVTAQKLDVRGWALASFAVLVVVVGFRQLGPWGWDPPEVTGVLVASAIAFTVAIRWLRRVEHPLLELGVYGVPTFRLVMVIGGLQTLAMYARVAFLPTELQLVRGMTAQRVGVLFMLGALAIAGIMPLGGWLTDRIGPRLPVVVGQAVVAVSLWGLAHITPGTSEGELLLILIGGGLGIGLSVNAPMVAGMNALPARWVGQGSTMSSLTRQVAGAIGTSVLAAVLISRIGAVAPVDAASRTDEVQSAYNTMFLVVFWSTVGATILAARLPNRPIHATDENRRAVAEVTEAAGGV